MALPSQNRRLHWHERPWVWVVLAVVWAWLTSEAVAKWPRLVPNEAIVPEHAHEVIASLLGKFTPSVSVFVGILAAAIGLAITSRLVYPQQDPGLITAIRARFNHANNASLTTTPAKPVVLSAYATRAALFVVPLVSAVVIASSGMAGMIILLLPLGALLLANGKSLVAGLVFGAVAWMWPFGGLIMLWWLAAMRKQWVAAISMLGTWVMMSISLDGGESISLGRMVVGPFVPRLQSEFEKLFGNINFAVVAFVVLVTVLGAWIAMWPRLPRGWAAKKSPWESPQPRQFVQRLDEQPSQAIARELGLALAVAAVIDPTTQAMIGMGFLSLMAGVREHDLTYRRSRIAEWIVFPLAWLCVVQLASGVFFSALLEGGRSGIPHFKFMWPLWMFWMAWFVQCSAILGAGVPAFGVFRAKTQQPPA